MESSKWHKSASTQKLVSDILKKKTNNEIAFEPYIRSIRFPKYKMLEPNTKITFEFPFTVLIGENGCNKTSVLQALYGAPINKSVGEFWFETDVDKISSKETNCLIYEYKQQKMNKNVETLKTRIKKVDNPDYWEPSRPIKSYNMEIPTEKELEKSGNKSKTRWDQIEKPVVYCDCKGYISAYDLFFYHYNFSKSKKYKTRQDFIRARSKYLSEVIRNGSEDFDWYGKNQIQSNERLPDLVCKAVSHIMGENYSEIRIITHTLYSNGDINKPSKTIWMKKNNMTYSEAFAGTGESRIILIVNDVLNAKENSLILIDEPEVSLHPKAIVNLKKFLLNEVLVHGHQVVLTTHSPQMIKDLPNMAIKFMMEKSNSEINISNQTEYGEAFFELQEEIDNPIKIYVEDKLSQFIVDKVVEKKFKEYDRERISIQVIPGGAENIISNYVTASAYTDRKQEYYLLDGDKNKFEKIDGKFKKVIDRENGQFLSKDLKAKDNNCQVYESIIEQLVGFKLNLHSSSNPGSELLELQDKFLNFWAGHVKFFSCETPELGIIRALGGENTEDDKNGKTFFVECAKKMFDVDKPTSEDVYNCERAKVACLDNQSQLFIDIENVVNEILEQSKRCKRQLMDTLS